MTSDVEKEVLGALILSPHRWDSVADLLSEETFLRAENRAIFASMVTLNSNSTFVALTRDLELHGHADAIVRSGYLLEVMQSVSGSAHLDYHIGLLRDRDRKRRVGQALNELQAELQDVRETTPEAVNDFIADAERRIWDAGVSRGEVLTETKLGESARDLEQRWTNRDVLQGISTGVWPLDAVLGPLAPGSMHVIAARPGGGKTALALQIALAAALRQEHSVFFSIEMPPDELVARLIANHAAVDMTRAKSGETSVEERAHISNAVGALGAIGSYLHLYDGAKNATVSGLRAAIRRTANCALAVVDYLQLMQAPKDCKSEYEAVTANSKGVKLTARQLGVPIIAVAQLNRKAVEREIPSIADLRSSGQIEQDADSVTILSLDPKQDLMRPKVSVTTDIAKNRNGPTRVVTLDFDRPIFRITEQVRSTSSAIFP